METHKEEGHLKMEAEIGGELNYGSIILGVSFALQSLLSQPLPGGFPN